MPTAAAQDEVKWAKQNPPQVTMTADELTLWNYPVGKSDLSDTFETAITNFLLPGITDGTSDAYEISIRGHASASGEGSFDNTALSQSRADAVADFVRQLGYTKLNVSAAGSAEPVDNSGSGQALARNRRADITFFVSQPPAPPQRLQTSAPVPSLPGSHAVQLSPRAAPSDLTNLANTATSFAIAGKLSIPALKGTLLKLDWTVSYDISYELRETKANSGDPRAIKAVTDGRNLSAKFEEQLTDFVRSKISIEPPTDGKPGSIKVGAQRTDIPFKPEFGLQLKPQFFYVTVELDSYSLGPIDYNGVRFQVVIKGSAKMEFGPSAALLADLGRFTLTSAEASEAAGAAGLGTDAAAIATGSAGLAGGVVITVTCLAALPYLVDSAKQRGLDLAAKMSTCDGAGAQAALEILGPGASAAFESRKSQFRTAEALQSFAAGVDLIRSRLMSLSPADKNVLLQRWKDKYAQTQDFDTVAAAIAMKLGVYDRDVQSVDVTKL